MNKTICVVISGGLSGQGHTHRDANHPYANHPPLSVVALLRLETMCIIASTPAVMIDAVLIHLVS